MMMTHYLSVKAQFRPEVLERILRVVRHRGFTISMMNMRQETHNRITIDMVVFSERQEQFLTRQLEKLSDVEFVITQHSQTQAQLIA